MIKAIQQVGLENIKASAPIDQALAPTDTVKVQPKAAAENPKKDYKTEIKDMAEAIKANSETKETETPENPSSVSKEEEVVSEIMKRMELRKAEGELFLAKMDLAEKEEEYSKIMEEIEKITKEAQIEMKKTGKAPADYKEKRAKAIEKGNNARNEVFKARKLVKEKEAKLEALKKEFGM